VETREAEPLLVLDPDVAHVYVHAPSLCGAGLWHVHAWHLIQGVVVARTFPLVVTIAGGLPIESGSTWLALASAFSSLAASASGSASSGFASYLGLVVSWIPSRRASTAS